MPLDGVVMKCVAAELNKEITGGRVERVFQPEADEILIHIRTRNGNRKLVMSANSRYPRIHLTESPKENPAFPPAFCMVLRKHIQGSRVLSVSSRDYERVVSLEVESSNELGDLSVKRLIVEVMGRHSNIILVNSENIIIDSIKHVDVDTSGVRQVMPARAYTPPPDQGKTSPACIDASLLIENALTSPGVSLGKYLLDRIKGFSPLLCTEICRRAGVDENAPADSLEADEVRRLKETADSLLAEVRAEDFRPFVAFKERGRQTPTDFHCVRISHLFNKIYMDSINQVLDLFYAAKDADERLKQSRAALYKVLNNAIDRCKRKISLLQENLKSLEDREKLKLMGELITANLHSIPQGASRVSLLNYYSQEGEYLEVELDPGLSPSQNAQLYYKKYAKAKSSYAHAVEQLEVSREELSYLESVAQALENCKSQADIQEVRQELEEQDYLPAQKSRSGVSRERPSGPYHFKSSDGFDIYVGKNNRQNDFLTFKMSHPDDIWLHARNIPGSHVIIRKNGKEVPDSTLTEAAMLAAYYSKARLSSNVPVDYTTVRNVKKPRGAKPGMVNYFNFKTIAAAPDESRVGRMIKQE